jgi:hypothetical protein
MLEEKTITDLVKEEIKNKVSAYVDSIVSDISWQREFEQKIAQYIESRVTGKFLNAAEVPGLVDAIKSSVSDLFDQGRVPTIDSYVDSQVIQQTVDSATQELVLRILSQFELDAAWLDKIQKLSVQNMSQRVSDLLSKTDVNQMISGHISASVEKWHRELAVEYAGIRDLADDVKVTIMNDAVVVDSDLAVNNLLVEQSIQTKTLTVDNLVLKNSANIDTHAWDELVTRSADSVQKILGQKWQKSLVEQVLDIAKNSSINFDSITIDGEPLVSGNTLSGHITDTAIEQTGKLRSLAVRGAANLANNTLNADNQRVGINTREPEMALSIWDEEVTAMIGKLSQDTAYIGTSRPHDLVLGINRKPQIRMDRDGLTTINKLRIDRWKIQHAGSVPGWSGTRGDWVFNNEPKEGEPFAWVCLGAYQWRPLKSL